MSARHSQLAPKDAELAAKLAAAAGTGGVAKIDVRTRTVVATFVYPEKGRTHGIAYLDGRGRKH